MAPRGIIANSFPKSGTHILTEFLSIIRYKASDLHLSRSLLVYGPRNIFRNIKVHSRLEKDAKKGLHLDLENSTRKAKESWLRKHVNSTLVSNHYCQAHLPFTQKLEDFLISNNYKMLYIHRNPLDVLVSLKNYILKKKNYPNHKLISNCKNDDERFLILLEGFKTTNNANYMAPFFEKYSRSISWSSSNWVCSVSFENIIGPSGGGSNKLQKDAISKMLSYLDRYSEAIDVIQSKIYNPKSATFHKGSVNQWQKELSPKIIELCKEKMKLAHIEYKSFLE